MCERVTLLKTPLRDRQGPLDNYQTDLTVYLLCLAAQHGWLYVQADAVMICRRFSIEGCDRVQAVLVRPERRGDPLTVRRNLEPIYIIPPKPEISPNVRWNSPKANRN